MTMPYLLVINPLGSIPVIKTPTIQEMMFANTIINAAFVILSSLFIALYIAVSTTNTKTKAIGENITDT